jgi:hypothetical protein
MKIVFKYLVFMLLCNNAAFSQCGLAYQHLQIPKSTPPTFTLVYTLVDGYKSAQLIVRTAYTIGYGTIMAGVAQNYQDRPVGDGYAFTAFGTCIDGTRTFLGSAGKGTIIIPPPTNVIATVTCNSVTLKWDAVTTAIAHWNVIDCASNAVVATVTSNSATINSLNAHTTHSYQVLAVTVSDFSSAPTACVTATTLDAAPSMLINGSVPNADGSAILVSNCAPILLDASGSTCASQFYITMEESDIWWNQTLTNKWSATVSATANNNFDLISLTELYSQPQYGGTGKFTLIGGLLPNGQARYYRVSISTFNTAWTTTHALIQILTGAKPLFNINGNLPTSNGSPIQCGSTVTCNAANTTCARSFFLGIQECDLYWNRTFANEWGQWFDGSPPDNMDLVALTNKYSSTVYNGTGNFTLQGGILPNGQARYYRVVLATGNPTFNALYALIRINPTIYAKTDCSIGSSTSALIPIDHPIPEEFKVRKNKDGVQAAARNSSLENLPNPFSNETNIEFNIQSNAMVSLQVFDIRGALVKTLLNNEVKDAGFYMIPFDGTSLPGGIYYTHLTVDSIVNVKKMILIK